MAQDSIDRHIAFWSREVTDLDPDVEGAVTRMQMLVHHLRRHREAALAVQRLRGWQYDILWRLRSAGPPYEGTPSWLAEALDVPPATLTSRLDRLERQGHIARAGDPADRRRLLVRLTEQGQDAWLAVIREQTIAEHALLDCLTGAQRRQLAELLRAVVVAAEGQGPPLMPVPDTAS
ncbi:MarR family winged helix-turn-helix transcriptional regulator [Actinomadura macra]|uniref:MarR family winged helix-turn-helix transcriptional regulator n=1 Tax=Actinomadura macra TaxID=46164 RepID=UPI00082CBCAA|nr:MarR family transcriptional regulator [Actinomadura macra]